MNGEQVQAITKPKLLLVEGRDEFNFFNALLRHLEQTEMEISIYGGKDRLRARLRTLPSIIGFDNLKSIGIVRDTDDDANAAFQSVCSSLANANFPVPVAPLQITDTQPQVGVMIMPPNANQGMLEDLCLAAVAGDAAMRCVEQYFQCLEAEMGNLPQNESKARMHAFLASRESPDLRLGEAALRGYLPWDSPAFESVKRFING